MSTDNGLMSMDNGRMSTDNGLVSTDIGLMSTDNGLMSMDERLMSTDNWSVLAAGPRVRTGPRAVRGEPGSRDPGFPVARFPGVPTNHPPVPTACPGGRVVPTDAADGFSRHPGNPATRCRRRNATPSSPSLLLS